MRFLKSPSKRDVTSGCLQSPQCLGSLGIPFCSVHCHAAIEPFSTKAYFLSRIQSTTTHRHHFSSSRSPTFRHPRKEAPQSRAYSSIALHITVPPDSPGNEANTLPPRTPRTERTGLEKNTVAETTAGAWSYLYRPVPDPPAAVSSTTKLY